jgi:hypothetical protein
MRHLAVASLLVLAFLPCGLRAGDAPPLPLPPAPDVTAAPTCPDLTPACPDKEPCCPTCPCDPRFYASADYLLWWIKSAPVPPPILTTSTNNNPRATITDPNTRVLFGGTDYDMGAFSGARITAGWQFTPELGVEASGFLLQQRTRSSFFKSDALGNPVLATPFFDVLFNQESASFYSLPTPTGGSASFLIDLNSQLWGTEANATARVYNSDHLKLKVLAGFRYLDLSEKVRIIDNAIFFAPTTLFSIATFPAFSRFPALDEFDTHNQFYAGQIGAEADACFGRFRLNLLGKMAFGSMHEVITVSGATQAIPAGTNTPVLTVPGDSFALLSNIGRSAHNEFSIAPEVSLNLGYQLTSAVAVFIGYDFLYLGRVARPGDQIDRRWNSSQIPTFGTIPFGGSFPAPMAQQDDFYAHGLNFGVSIRF